MNHELEEEEELIHFETCCLPTPFAGLPPRQNNVKGCKELTHWKRLWCWEGLGAGGEGDDRGWDGWMASLTQWTWVWVNSGSWWGTGRPGVLRFMGSQRVRHDWATDLIWSDVEIKHTHTHKKKLTSNTSIRIVFIKNYHVHYSKTSTTLKYFAWKKWPHLQMRTLAQLNVSSQLT